MILDARRADGSREYNPTFQALRDSYNVKTFLRIKLGLWRNVTLNEVGVLCRQLAFDGFGSTNKDSVTIGAEGMLEIVSGAYEGRIYKEFRSAWVIPLNLSTAANAAAAIGVFVLTFSQNNDKNTVNTLIQLNQQQTEQLKELEVKNIQSLDSLRILKAQIRSLAQPPKPKNKGELTLVPSSR